ncbi:MAG: sugar phosphate isomerase/epimerase [Chloroflexota bacterium]|nr:sugar phosphate isomerase/epimerase [Chloroflexota bacterium]
MFDYFASSVAFGEQPLAEACAALRKIGVNEVDIWSVANWCNHIPPEDPRPDLEDVKRTLDEYQLSCQAISAYGKDSDEMLLARLEHLAALGGKMLVRGSAPDEITVKEFANGFMPFVRRAEELGVQIAIENHRGHVINTIASMRELLERVESPGLGIAFAPIHVHIAQENIAEAIHAVGDRIGLFYAWDWGPTADENWRDPQEQVPGTGVIDFHAMFRALSEIGHESPLCLFAHGLEYERTEDAVIALQAGLGYCQQVERDLGLR